MTQPPLRIPFNIPTMVGAETQYMADAVSAGHISGDGAFSRSAERLLQSLVSSERVLLTTSCTHALELAALLLNIGPGDEVIVPSFTFVSTINAFALRGARPVFADIREDTLNLDESLLEGLITDRTRVVLPVHYGGVGCQMDTIEKIAEDTGVSIVEDNAHGLLGTFQGRPLGSFGVLATQSFHETKNFTCGEGGALVINDPNLIERAEILREKGTNRSQFFRGQVDKYSWVDVGSSYLPSDLLGAMLLAQLEQRHRIQRTTPDHLGTVRRRAQQLGGGPSGPAAHGSRPVRTGLPSLLPAPALPRGPDRVHRAPAESRHLVRVPLRPAEYVGNGSEVRWIRRSVSGLRGRLRSTGEVAVLLQPDRRGPAGRRRRHRRVPVRVVTERLLGPMA